LAFDSRGGVWFTETHGDGIGRVDPESHAVTEFKFERRGVSATGIAIDSHDRVWAAGRDGNVVIKYDPASERFDYFAVSTPNAKPCGIVVDQRDRVWFTERDAGKLATIALTYFAGELAELLGG
jgi:virginiamycin B lyase